MHMFNLKFKAIFFIAVGIINLFLIIFVQLHTSFSNTKTLKIEKQILHGTVIINSAKYAVPYHTTTTSITVTAKDFSENFFLNDRTGFDCLACILTSTIIYALSIFYLILSAHKTDKYSKAVSVKKLLIILTVVWFTCFCYHLYVSSTWIEDLKHGLTGWNKGSENTTTFFPLIYSLIIIIFL